MDNLNTSNLMDQLADEMNHFLQGRLELIMREEIQNFLREEAEAERPNSRNGYYHRDLNTRFGKVEQMAVPRDRKSEFQSGLFEPYARREGWLEEAVIQMYKSGMSTREVGRFIERIIGDQYSPTTISNITHTVMEDIEKWQWRPLNRRYSILYMDGLYVPLRRGTVDHEAVYVVMGIDEEGHRQILGFYIGGKESATTWKDVFRQLRERGVEEVLLGVSDGLAGLKDAFLEAFPQADYQRCVVHKLRNTAAKVRKKDQPQILNDLKPVYNAPTYEEAVYQFHNWRDKWKDKYPREVASWQDDLDDLLRFYKYPPKIWRAIYTTNAIERTNKEIRKRFKTMNSLTNLEAAEKIAYLVSEDYNEKWSQRVIPGFGDVKTKRQLEAMYVERYGTKEIVGNKI